MIGKRSEAREVARPNAPTNEPAASGSVISKGMRVVGDCETDGELRIDGTVAGNVRAKGLKLGASGAVEGDLDTPEGADGGDVFVIRGRVDGAVRARKVEVGRGGSVLGGLVADQATIQGHVQGGIVARERLLLEDTAVVEGDVHARRLGLKEGGQVNGNIHMGDRAVIPPANGRVKSAGRPEIVSGGEDETLVVSGARAAS